MKSLVKRTAWAGMALVVLTASSSLALGQDDCCPHCGGWHAHRHGGYGAHGPYGHTHLHAALGSAGANFGDCVYRYYGEHDLFGQYYLGNNCGGYGAALYVSPLPVPPHVGHTFITYQPLMPHHFMYRHHHTYHRYYNGGMGLTRASVHYR
jgi:hypothetical protein